MNGEATELGYPITCISVGCTNPTEPRSTRCLVCELEGKGSLVAPMRSVFLGTAIRTRLDDLRLTSTQLAGRIGMHPTTITLWLLDERPVPAYRIEPLADALEVSVEWLTAQPDERPALPAPVVVVEADVPAPVEQRVPWRGLERIEAFTLAPLTGPSPSPGRPRSAS